MNPVVATAQKRLQAGEYARAVSDAYHRVVLDLQRAYALTLPAQWTHREFLSEFLREDMGIVTTQLERLYRLYEPVRYGTESDWVKGDLVELLTGIYSEPAMRDLYRKGASVPSRAGGSPLRPDRARTENDGLPATLR